MANQPATAKKPARNSAQLLWSVVGLQTPAGRILFFVAVTIGVFLVPFRWLENLSLWKRLDIPSPSIGLTRAYWRLLHGDVAGAWQQNKLIFVVIAIGGSLLAHDIYQLVASRRRAENDAK